MKAPPSRRTGALYVASNLPEEPVTADDGGWVEVRYGEDGNALAVTVHGRCGSPLENSIALDCRSATDDPEEAIALSCAYSCATEQHYTYAWVTRWILQAPQWALLWRRALRR